MESQDLMLAFKLQALDTLCQASKSVSLLLSLAGPSLSLPDSLLSESDAGASTSFLAAAVRAARAGRCMHMQHLSISKAVDLVCRPDLKLSTDPFW